MQGIGQIATGSEACPILPATPVASSLKAIKRQSNLRLAVGWLLLAIWIVSAWSLDWDADWHTRVGRDGFWTPPHWVFYTTVAACGILCLGMVVLETFLYYRRYPGFTKETTTPILFFRGPVGFALAGFGLAIMLFSAPLDDYWHRLFGIDVKVWAPFHVMLLLGIIMANVGILYLFASEVTRRRKWQTTSQSFSNQPLSLPNQIFRDLASLLNPATLGLIAAAVFLMTRYLFLMGSDTATNGTLHLAGFYLPSYSLVILALPPILIAVAGATGRFGSATLVGLFFLLFRLADTPLIEWGVKIMVQDQKRSGTFNEVTWTLIYPLYLPLVGLAIDLIFLLTRTWRSEKARRNWLVAGGAGLLGSLLLFLLDKPWELFNALIKKLYLASGDPSVTPELIESHLFKPDYWAVLPLVLILGACLGLVGWAWATSLRYTER